MKIIFALVGLVFDIVIMAASAAALYSALQPSWFYDNVDTVGDFLQRTDYRLYAAGVAAAFLVLSFRSFFLLAFRKNDRVFKVRSDDNGTLTVSRATLENVTAQLAASMSPTAKVSSIRIRQQRNGKLKVAMRIRLSLTGCALNEYTKKFDSAVKTYFADSLGLTIERMDLQASSISGAIPPQSPTSDNQEA